jgi:hypothetical protein
MDVVFLYILDLTLNCLFVFLGNKFLTELTEHKKTMTFDGNAGPGLGQAQKRGRTHVYKQKIKKSANSLPLKRPYITFDDNLWS